jgi:DNA-binding response OmpR family regulator
VNDVGPARLRRALIVEDEAVVALDLGMCFEDWGWEVAGPAHDLAAAERLALDPLDFALLDVNLAAGTTFELARRLVAQGVRVAFLTGSERDDLPPDLADRPSMTKPADFAELRRLAEG